MSFRQQPPFLICVPIAHNADLPGLAARAVEALLDRLGNPAGPEIAAALDVSTASPGPTQPLPTRAGRWPRQLPQSRSTR